jgi:hypothetical protein
MFEAALIAKLKADTTVCGYVSAYGASVAIFSDEAPQGAAFPYIVIRIDESNDSNKAIMPFVVNIDYFDQKNSRVDSRKLANRIINLLDHCTLDSDRFSKIRIFFSNGGPIREGDPRNIHYNLQFDARGGRIEYCTAATTRE